MKTIGMLGGMSWESTASYYRAINTCVKQRLGGLHSAKICLVQQEMTGVPLYATTALHCEAVEMALREEQGG